MDCIILSWTVHRPYVWVWVCVHMCIIPSVFMLLPPFVSRFNWILHMGFILRYSQYPSVLCFVITRHPWQQCMAWWKRLRSLFSQFWSKRLAVDIVTHLAEQETSMFIWSFVRSVGRSFFCSIEFGIGVCLWIQPRILFGGAWMCQFIWSVLLQNRNE